MQKNTYLKSLMLLTLFAGLFLSVPVVNAAKPTSLTATFHDHIAYPDYFPGIPTPLGESSMMRIADRMSEFTLPLPLPGFDVPLPCTVTSTEDSIVNMATGVGTTRGRITIVSDLLGPLLTAESNGKVYPTLVDGIPVPVMGFSGHFTSIGNGNVMRVNGEYSGYFIPDGPMSGFLHMDFTFAVH